MKEVALPASGLSQDAAAFVACLATILELPADRIPAPTPAADPARDWPISRWLGGLGIGLVPIADAATFAWPGPWLARLRPAGGGEPRAVVMYGVPSGVVWDPSGVAEREGWTIDDGFLVAPGDIALARPRQADAPTGAGSVEAIWIAPSAGVAAESVAAVRAIPGSGLEGDRHARGTGTFPSFLPGSALTLIAAEVCDSFSPPLGPDEHRRNVVTRGIDLNGLVGRAFTIGGVRCRGMRLCEPCTVVQGYATRPVLRPLVHRGGLRADIVEEGTIAVGDPVRVDPADKG